MKAPTATPSLDEELRVSKRKKKPPTTKNTDFFMVNNTHYLDSNSFTIFHQNICGLKSKTDELISSMLPSPPQIICLTEHHLKYTEVDQINIEGFKLCTAYCRQTMKKGEVCIFAQNGHECSKIEVNKYCKEQDIEICMLNFNLLPLSFI
jgi:hypothetical protein